MQFILIALAILAVVSAGVIPQNDYLPPSEELVGELPLATEEQSNNLADDGYRYKTVRRLKHRNRRDVSELASNEYLPPTESDAGLEYLPPVETESAPVEESAVLADDGYRYKTVRRLKYRKRRDVSELASNEYLPPTESDAGLEYLPPVETESAPVEESAVLADDGYRYKTVRRLKYRKRRDVSELASNEYLPPTESDAGLEYLPPVETESAPVEESAVLADDGYRYKTVRRLKYRKRRDVSELASNEYLPPTESDAGLEYLPPVETESAPVEESAVLADDGYRYKTVRRLKYRKRRDVSELASNEYLPPSDNGVVGEAPESEETTILADDGYRYKTVRRLKYRN